MIINNILYKNNHLVLQYSGSDDDHCPNEGLKSEKLICPLSHPHPLCFSLSFSHTHTHTGVHMLFFKFSGDIGSIGVMIFLFY